MRCGNQIGAKFWEVIADEHGIDPTGVEQSKWVWVKIKPPGYGPKGFVLVSQGGGGRFLTPKCPTGWFYRSPGPNGVFLLVGWLGKMMGIEACSPEPRVFPSHMIHSPLDFLEMSRRKKYWVGGGALAEFFLNFPLC